MLGTIQEIASASGLASIEPEWRELEGRSVPSCFLSWSWIGPWAEFALEEPPLYLFRAEDSGQAVALAFLCPWSRRAQRLLPSRALTLNEQRLPKRDMFIEYNGILAEPTRAGEAWACLLNTLVEHPLRCDELVVKMLDRATMPAPPAGWIEKTEETFNTWALDIVHKQEVDDVLRPLSRNRRWRIRRAIRHAESNWGPIECQIASSEREVDELLEEFARLHTRRWEKVGRSGAFGNPHWTRFHTALIRNGVPRGNVQFVRVKAGERTLGILYNLVHSGCVSVLQTGIAEPDGKEDLPGYVSHVIAIVENARLGRHTYDFLLGDDDYKASMTEAGPAIHSITLLRQTPQNRINLWVLDNYRRLQAIKDRLLQRR